MASANDYFLKLQEFLTIKYRQFFVKKADKKHFKQLKENGIPIKKLSKEQKHQINVIYKGMGKYNYNTHKLVYSVTGKFDPRIVPETLFRTKLEIKLNKGDFKYAWDDKSYSDVFLPYVKFPKLIFRNISGVFYDENFNVISKQQVIDSLIQKENFVIKKSYDSGFGEGVKLVIPSKDNIDKIIDDFKIDFIIQDVFKQNEIMAQFNSSSVNIIRYNSLLINGRVFPLSATLRVGASGAFNDHSIFDDGKGMVVIGLDKNGKLKDKAYYACGVLANNDFHIKSFEGIQIPGFNEMTKIIIDSHKRLGYFGFIGWDFAVGKDGKPVVMEYNLNGAGVLYYQYTNGPLFGEYTELVMEYLKNK